MVVGLGRLGSCLGLTPLRILCGSISITPAVLLVLRCPVITLCVLDRTGGCPAERRVLAVRTRMTLLLSTPSVKRRVVCLKWLAMSVVANRT